MRKIVSPGCTTGPFFPVAFSDGSEDLTQRNGQVAKGQHITLTGRVLELGGKPARNMVVEIWQTDSAGIFRHPLDPRHEQCDPGFWCWGRARTDGDGWYRFRTIMPGEYQNRCAHINVAILGIGLTRRLVTCVFFGPQRDPILDCVPAELRPRLITQGEDDTYRFDVILRGENETPFFVD